MHYFYAPGAIDNGPFLLDEQEAHHAIHVLRMKTQDHLYLLDGAGNIFLAEIIDISKKRCAVQVIEKMSSAPKKNYRLHIAIGPPKSVDRFDFFLEKATEIGVDEITPLITQNSERRRLNMVKLHQALIAALKQSGTAWLPKLHEPITFERWIRDYLHTGQKKIICHCREGAKQTLTAAYPALSDAVIMIGPEGDFTADEVNLAIAHGYLPATLGDMRLRTETAGIVACSMIHTINQLNDEKK